VVELREQTDQEPNTKDPPEAQNLPAQTQTHPTRIILNGYGITQQQMTYPVKFLY